VRRDILLACCSGQCIQGKRLMIVDLVVSSFPRPRSSLPFIPSLVTFLKGDVVSLDQKKGVFQLRSEACLMVDSASPGGQGIDSRGRDWRTGWQSPDDTDRLSWILRSNFHIGRRDVNNPRQETVGNISTRIACAPPHKSVRLFLVSRHLQIVADRDKKLLCVTGAIPQLIALVVLSPKGQAPQFRRTCVPAPRGPWRIWGQGQWRV